MGLPQLDEQLFAYIPAISPERRCRVRLRLGREARIVQRPIQEAVTEPDRADDFETPAHA